jgi:hypothetical protein
LDKAVARSKRGIKSSAVPRLCLTFSLIETVNMIQLQASSRYYSREGLLKFLRRRFGSKLSFKVNEVGDGYFTFEAPQALTSVS